MHYLVASCDADHEVSKLGDDLLRRRCVWDTNRPSVNLEDPKIAGSLYRAFLGGDPSTPEASRAAPASPAMKIKLVNLLCRSVTAANSFPLTVQTIFTCLYGEGTTTRLKAAGMKLAVWVLRHATDAQLKQASPLLLSGMLKLLDAGAAGAPRAERRRRRGDRRRRGRRAGRRHRGERGRGGVHGRVQRHRGRRQPPRVLLPGARAALGADARAGHRLGGYRRARLRRARL